MKNKNSFIFKGLISLVLSLVMIFGTTVTSLSAVTDNIVAAVTEPVRSAIPDAPAPAQSTEQEDLSTQSASNAPDYAVAEGSMLAEPADDDVLDISIDEQKTEISNVVETNIAEDFADAPVSNSYDNSILSSKRENDIAATGTAGTLDPSKTYNVGVQNGNVSYNLEYVNNSGINNTSGWVVKQTSTGKYLNADGFGQYNEKAEKYDVLSKAIVMEAEYDAGSNTYYFKGNYPDPRGDTVGWYLYWRAEAQEAWLGHVKTGSGIPGDEVIDPTPSTYSVTVKQMVTNDGINFTETNDAATLSSSPSDITGLSADTPVALTQSQTGTQRETYTFLGWYVGGSYVETLASYSFTVTSDVTVEARYTTNPSVGSYKFTYDRRDIDVSGGDTTWTKTVSVPLNGAELAGYSGNDNHAGVPTFLWTAEAKTLFNNVNPLVTAALALEGNEEDGGDNWQKDASVYKCDLVWDNLNATSQGSNVTYDATAHTVTIEATTTPYKFRLLYYTVNGGTATFSGTAYDLEYGKAVTFNPIYKGSTEYAYVDYTVPSENFSYWSADPEGNIPITTNLTYGMIMRGDYMDDNDDDKTVHIYAQYNRTINEAWKPLIEEVKLTHTIDDDHDWVYLDYMTNYLSQAGTVVQEMEVKPEYGIVVAKYSSEMTTLDKTKMESVANAMITGNRSSAYLNREKTAIAYRFNYNDNAHISDFNRVLYTLKSDTDKAENMQFTAIAYIVVDDVKYYSLINTDITVIDLVL
jgi:hypothetical protein